MTAWEKPPVRADDIPSPDNLLRFGFYNVGIQQNMLENKNNRQKSMAKIEDFVLDIVDAFENHDLDLLGLCEVGRHESGLHGWMYFDAPDQKTLMHLVVAKAKVAIRRIDVFNKVGARELDLILVSCDIPSYAFIARSSSKFQVDLIRRERNLDTRGLQRPERHMVVCEGRWDGRKINVGLCHCPSSDNYKWDQPTRAVVIPQVLQRVSTRRNGNGAAEPVAWILGGDLDCGQDYLSEAVKHYQPNLNCGVSHLSEAVKHYQPNHDTADLQNEKHKFVQHIPSHLFKVLKGDIALVQHLRAFQTNTSIGRSYGGVSDAHDLVIVPVCWPQPDIPTQQTASSASSIEIPEKQASLAANDKSAGARKPCGNRNASAEPGEDKAAAKVGAAANTESTGVADSHANKTVVTPSATGAVEPGDSKAVIAPSLREKAAEAALLLAHTLEDAGSLKVDRGDRRLAFDGRLYLKDEFVAYYGSEHWEDYWEAAPLGQEFPWDDDPAGDIGRALWPRETPKRMIVQPNGAIMIEAATSACNSVIEDIFATLLRVRQAEFASGHHARDPDAWDTGAAEPGVPIDIHTTLSDEAFQSAWGRWRKQWQDRVVLTPAQAEAKRHLSGNAFNKIMRSAFLALLKKYMGEPHVAKFVIRHGAGPPDSTTVFGEFLQQLADIKADRRKRKAEDTPGAEESVRELRRTALQTRWQWREGRRLSNLDYNSLNASGRALVDDWLCGALSAKVDRANKAYGHGIARTHDFGYKPGQNMNTQMSTDVAAALKRVKTDEK